MSILKTSYQYEGDKEIRTKEVDLNILKQYSLNEIQLMFVMNFMMPIEPISHYIDEYQLWTDTESNNFKLRKSCEPLHLDDKIIKLEHEQVLSLFPSKNTFYDTVTKLINKDIIKRVGRNKYALPKSIFSLSNTGGTSFDLFKEFNNEEFNHDLQFHNQDFPEYDDDQFFDGSLTNYWGDYHYNPVTKVATLIE